MMARALRQILLQGLLLALGLAMLLGTVGIPLSHLALEWMQPSPELNQLTRDFFHTRLFGLPAALASYALVGWFLGTQNARAPLAILLTTNLVNIALNLWFVLGLDWGVVGSARASVIAEWTGALLGLALTQKALRAYPGHIAWAALKRWHSWRPLLAVNRDIFIRSLALQVGVLCDHRTRRTPGGCHGGRQCLAAQWAVADRACPGRPGSRRRSPVRARHRRPRPPSPAPLAGSAGGWSLIASVGFALLFTLAGHVFIAMRNRYPQRARTGWPSVNLLAVLPLIAVWIYCSMACLSAQRARAKCAMGWC